METGVIKFLSIMVVLLFWGLATTWAYLSVKQIWHIRNADARLTVRLIWRSVSKNPFAGVVGLIKERPELEVILTRREGYTFTPHGGESINTEALLRDHCQYSLIVANQGDESLSPVELRIQFPYPVSNHEILTLQGADGIDFSPIGLAETVSGQVTVNGHPISPNYALHVGELRPHGRVAILLLLNSSRDPRGKTFPKEKENWPSIPDWGPTRTYIYGTFKHRVGEETIEREYYAPLELAEDKTVTLGPSGPRPKLLRRRDGWEMEPSSK